VSPGCIGAFAVVSLYMHRMVTPSAVVAAMIATSGDEVLWRKDGTSFPVEYWSYRLYNGKQAIGAVVSFLDITERKFAEQKLKAANEDLMPSSILSPTICARRYQP